MLNRSNITIKSLVTAIVTGLVMIVLGVGVYGYVSVGEMNNSISTIYNHDIIPMQHLRSVNRNYDLMYRSIVEAAQGKISPQEGVLRIETAIHDADEAWGQYQKSYMDNEEK